MKLKEFIRGEKANVHHGEWGDEKLRQKDFPLSKRGGRVYPLTRQWRWRMTTLAFKDRKFRIMTTYHKAVPEFAAVVAEDLGKDSRVVARLEFHGSHDGWHMHPICTDFDNVVSGITKPHGTVRLPSAKGFHRHVEILRDGKSMSDACAGAIVSSAFNLGDVPDLFFVGDLPW